MDEGEEPKPTRRRGRLSGISVATRIAGAVVVVSLFSLIVATSIGLTTGRDLGESAFDERIDAVRGSAGRDATRYLQSLETTAKALAGSPQATQAVKDFGAGLDGITRADLGNRDRLITQLAEEYQDNYLEPLGEAGLAIDVRDIINEANNQALYLQSIYSIGFEPLSSAAAVDDGRDGSEWTDAHRVYHPTYRRIVNSAGLFDVLLVDTDAGRIVYTTQKNPDLGTNVDVGPTSGSIVSTLVEQIRDDPDAPVQSADFRRYTPAVLTPVAGVAAPVKDGGELIGALVMLFDSSELTRLLTNDGDFSSRQFPEEGDVYLVGADDTTRTEPRGYLESPGEFLDRAQAAGQLNDDSRTAIDVSGTTVLELRAADGTVTAAEEGEVEPASRLSIDGRKVFSSVDALDYEGFPLFVVAEVTQANAEQALDDFQNLLIVGVAIFMVVLAFVAVWWGTSIMRPVRSLSDRLAVGAGDRDDPIDVPERSPIEFHRLAMRFETMATTLRSQHEQIREARAARLAMMKRMLPSAVAERLAAGDPFALDEAPNASVAVLTLTGLRADVDGEQQHDHLEEFLAELDGLARQHGLDPVKVIGDEYYAAVGHERPYIDHAPRAVAFAADAFDLVSASPLGTDHGLRLGAGVASGSVAVGLTGANGLVYDVWGVTARRADQLARRAGSDRLLVDDETAAKLPDSIGMEQYAEVTGQIAYEIDREPAGGRA